MQRLALSLLFLASSLLISVPVAAGQRVPESTWMQCGNTILWWPHCPDTSLRRKALIDSP